MLLLKVRRYRFCIVVCVETLYIMVDGCVGRGDGRRLESFGQKEELNKSVLICVNNALSRD